MTVDERLAGKKGRCKACQQILTVPNEATDSAAAATEKPQPQPPRLMKPTAPSAPKRESPAPPPPPPITDVEAEAAALFADEPQAQQPVEVSTVQLNCPFCDEAIEFPAVLAGKRAPCPECKRVIKVPELVKKDPKDWRKVEARGPSGARLPDQPAIEGAWGSTNLSTVGKQSLVEAGVIPKTTPPRTLRQRLRWPVLGVGVALLLGVVAFMGYRWWGRRAADRALKEAIAVADTANSPADVKAALCLGIGDYYMYARKPLGVEGSDDAKKRLGKAFTALQTTSQSSTRDFLFREMTRVRLNLAGDSNEVNQGLRLSWDEVQPMLRATLAEISDSEARRDELREVGQRLIERGQGGRILPLTQQIFSAADGDQAAAFAVVGLEFFRVNDHRAAERALDEALKVYGKEKPPPLRPDVITLALLLQKKLPNVGAEKEATANEHLGQVEALARQGKWEQAKQQAAKEEFGEDVQFRAKLALATSAVDSNASDAAALVEEAIQRAEKMSSKEDRPSWALFRLAEFGVKARVPEERLQAVPACIADTSLRNWAQLILFRAHLERTSERVEEADANKIKQGSVARAMAAQELARHNTRLDSAWAAQVQGWEQPNKAFGSLGVAYALQDRRR
jgi:hypothetical protein